MTGIFIGSFNPPTIAHYDIIKIMEKYFDKLVIIPVNSREKHLVEMNKRIEMLELLFHKDSLVIIDDLMNDYSYVNYRVIDLLKKKYGEITLIIGSDLLKNLDKFDNYEYLLSNYRFYVVTRDDDVKRIVLDKYSKYFDKFKFIEYHNNISSTKVRKLIQEKKDLTNVLDEKVSLYIKEHRLYF